MFGILLFTINALLAKLLYRCQQYRLSRFVTMGRCIITQLQNDHHQRQIYHKTTYKGTLQ
jgi:hypothetical protein